MLEPCAARQSFNDEARISRFMRAFIIDVPSRLVIEAEILMKLHYQPGRLSISSHRSGFGTVCRLGLSA